MDDAGRKVGRSDQLIHRHWRHTDEREDTLTIVRGQGAVMLSVVKEKGVDVLRLGTALQAEPWR